MRRSDNIKTSGVFSFSFGAGGSSPCSSTIDRERSIRLSGEPIMLDIPESSGPSVSEIQSRLHAVAAMLRESRTIDAESQRLLAELVDELSSALHSARVPTTEVAHIAESTAHLADSLHQQHDQGVLASARERLETALLDAESRSNIVALARRLLDALANIGI
jgi:hypothetical protein